MSAGLSRVFVFFCICVCICVYIYVCVCVYIHISMYVCIYIYIYIGMPQSGGSSLFLDFVVPVKMCNPNSCLSMCMYLYISADS